jgi:hypothetical protein
MCNSQHVADERDTRFSPQKLLPHIDRRRDDAAREAVLEAQTIARRICGKRQAVGQLAHGEVLCHQPRTSAGLRSTFRFNASPTTPKGP